MNYFRIQNTQCKQYVGLDDSFWCYANKAVDDATIFAFSPVTGKTGEYNIYVPGLDKKKYLSCNSSAYGTVGLYEDSATTWTSASSGNTTLKNNYYNYDMGTWSSTVNSLHVRSDMKSPGNGFALSQIESAPPYPSATATTYYRVYNQKFDSYLGLDDSLWCYANRNQDNALILAFSPVSGQNNKFKIYAPGFGTKKYLSCKSSTGAVGLYDDTTTIWTIDTDGDHVTFYNNYYQDYMGTWSDTDKTIYVRSDMSNSPGKGFILEPIVTVPNMPSTFTILDDICANYSGFLKANSDHPPAEKELLWGLTGLLTLSDWNSQLYRQPIPAGNVILFPGIRLEDTSKNPPSYEDRARINLGFSSPICIVKGDKTLHQHLIDLLGPGAQQNNFIGFSIGYYPFTTAGSIKYSSGTCNRKYFGSSELPAAWQAVVNAAIKQTLGGL